MQAKWRSRKNKIKKLKRVDGTWYDAPGELKRMTRDIFVDLFTSDDVVCPSQVLCHVEPKINATMNEDLSREFSKKEIADAMFQMGLLKAPGPDGFPARFYQRHWDIVGKDITTATQRFFCEGALPDGVNDTAIVLILKGNNP
jgi:hypothetical protein